MSAHTLSLPAIRDLEEIYDYVTENGSAQRAIKLLDRIVATCDRVGNFPALGRRRPEFDQPSYEIRSISEGEYVIFYCEQVSEVVLIVRVIHGKRDLADGFEV